jgi:hypothetical protein
MADTPQQLALERLESLYQRAMKASAPQVFFRSLIEYVELFDSSKILTAVALTIIEEGKVQTASLNELESTTLQEMRDVYKQFKDFIEQNNITDAEITFELDEFSAAEDGRLRSSMHATRLRYQRLSDVVYILVRKHFSLSKSFVVQFADIVEGKMPEDHRITNIELSQTYNRWNNSYAQYERIKLTKVWYSWDQMAFFYNIYNDYEPLLHSFVSKSTFLDAISLAMRFKKIDQLVNNSAIPKPQDLAKMEEYRQYMERVHFYTKECLSNMPVVVEQVPAEMIKKVKWDYDVALGKLTINECQLPFKPSVTRDVLAIVLLGNDSVRKEWFYDELNELIEGHEVENFGEEEKDRFYGICKRIVQRIATNSGVVQFLVFNKSSVKVNPIYLP